MKPKAQFGPLIRTDIGIGPFADISVKDQVRDQMIHRYDMYLEAPISETSIHRIRYRIRSISDYLDPISVQEKKCGGGRPGRFRTQWTKSILWGGVDGLPRDRPISEMILGRPSDRYRAGRAGGGESIRETICT